MEKLFEDIKPGEFFTDGRSVFIKLRDKFALGDPKQHCLQAFVKDEWKNIDVFNSIDMSGCDGSCPDFVKFTVIPELNSDFFKKFIV